MMENFGAVFEKIAMLYFEAPVEGSGLLELIPLYSCGREP
jgi:hypothetical protein